MILRRLAEGIKNQDWFVVGVEIMIVVVGIFIGLQVDDWNERRLDLQREGVVLDRLHQEAAAIVEFMMQQVDDDRQMILRMEQALDAIVNPVEGVVPSDEVLGGLLMAGRYAAISPPRAVYAEVIGSGGLSAISSATIRTAIAAYYAELDFVISQTSNFRRSAIEFNERADAGIIFSFDRGRFTRERVTYDYEKLVANTAFHGRYANQIRNHAVFSIYLLRALRAANDMCLALAATPGGACPDTSEAIALYNRDIRLQGNGQ